MNGLDMDAPEFENGLLESDISISIYFENFCH